MAKSHFANGFVFAVAFDNIPISAGSMNPLKSFRRGVIDLTEKISGRSLTLLKLRNFHKKFSRGLISRGNHTEIVSAGSLNV
jgi:hypothetical protein